VSRISLVLPLLCLTSILHAQAQPCHRGYQAVEHAVTSISVDSFTAGDFNEDGRADLVAKILYDHNFLLTNRGEELFEPSSLGDIAGPNAGFPLKAEDLTGDGHLDLVVHSSDSLFVRPGRGDGTFAEPVETPIGPGEDLRADMDGDGRLDWIEVAGNQAAIWMANTDGTLRKAGSFTIQAPDWSSIGALFFGDLDGDGRSDAIRFGRDFRKQDPEAQIFWNQGNLQFSTTMVDVPATLRWEDLRGVDIDGDGTTEMVSPAGDALNVVRGIGRTITIGSIRLTRHVEGFRPMFTADLDGDGRRDVVLDTYSAVGILWGRAEDETAFSVSIFDLPLAPQVAADFNGDGVDDLASVSSEGVAILHGARDRQLRGAPLSPVSGASRFMVETDIDHDGRVDLVVSSWDTNLEVLRGEPGSRFSIRAAIAGQHAGGAADLDGDGNIDLVTLSRHDMPKTSVYFGSDWIFTDPVEISATARFAGIATLSGAGRALVMNDAGALTLVSVASRTMVVTPIATGARSRTFVIDADGDGDSDVLAVDDDGAGSLFTQGAGGWTTSSVLLPIDRMEDVRAADLDGDGRTDLAARNEIWYAIFVARGDGTYLSQPVAQVFGFLSSLELSDVDRDGAIDVVLTSRANSSDPSMIMVHRNNGDGSTAPYSTLLFGPTLQGATIVADVDKDGWEDLVVSTPIGAAVLRNICKSPRVRAAAVPSVVREGEPIRLVVHALPSRNYLVGLITIREGGAILHMDQPSLAFDLVTLIHELPPLSLGRHDLTVEYEDQFAGLSSTTLTVHVVSKKGRRRAAR
jgi:FG-GAP-like repeat